MARIVKSPFVLNLADGSKKHFAVGDIVEGDESEHWYVQAHSEEPKDEAKTEKVARAPKKAAGEPKDEAKTEESASAGSAEAPQE